jgi:carbon monoxide dehydrogenase subunit G
MTVEVVGEIVASGTLAKTYAALTDPHWLMVAVPGIRECVPISNSRDDLACRMVWEVGMSMVRVRFAGIVGWTLTHPPEQLALTVSGAGSFGAIDLAIEVTLSPANQGTLISYRGQGEGPESTPSWKSKAWEPVAHFMVQRLVEALAEGGEHR